MLRHTLEVLEFEQIKEKLKTYVFSGLGKSHIDNIKFIYNKENLETALKEVSEIIFLLDNTHFPSLGIHDIRKELKRAKLENSYLDPDGLIKCASTLRAIRVLKSYLQSNEEETPLLNRFVKDFNTFKYIENEINNAIDDNSYEIKDTASKELAKIREKILVFKNRIEKKLNNLLRNRVYASAIQENLITVRDDRYVIPVKRDFKGKIPGIVLDTSSSGNTIFMEPSYVVEDNNTLMSLKSEEKQEEIRILKKITSLITAKWEEISIDLRLLGEFEFIYTKAQYSKEMKCNEVAVNDKGIFKIYKARHPLLSGDVVPVNLLIGQDYNMLIITGPNTGGKTVSLKTLGLLTLMTMAGMHIPAGKDSEVSIIDNIYTDIGDEQSIAQNLSTFSSHIKRISKILRKATNKSLVLIDEIGAGTDPREGSSIGISILENLLKRKSITMVSTHFARIKNFALRKKKVETASCEFDIKNLKPTYRILYGVPGDSNAITIAKKLGLHWAVIKRANQLFKKGSDKSESVIKTLTDEKNKYNKLFELYEQKVKEVTDKEQELREKEIELKEKENKIKKNQITDISKFVQESRKKLLNLIEEAKKSGSESAKIGKKMGEIDKISSEVKEILHSEAQLNNDYTGTKKDNEDITHTQSANGEIKEGDEVLVKTLGKKGKVVELGKKQDATIQVGGIKFVLPLSDLTKQYQQKEKDIENDIDVTFTTSSELYETPPYELNLLGVRAEEAVKRSEKYIESLHFSNREMGRIVHGKGEGILRRRIIEMLKNHPYVKSYRTPHPNDGGYGVTEVTVN
ncbi:MAG: endonuclease MutS2 [Spirochaetota bacterium]